IDHDSSPSMPPPPPSTEALRAAVFELEKDGAFHDTDGAQVAVPALDRVLLDEAVPAEQLDTRVADLHALVRGQFPGQRGFARILLALLRPCRRAKRD